MLCIYHESTDPYFNVATDEYILKYLKEDCFMLWRNDNAIIVGKYQNTLSEINYDYVKKNNIAIVRRISGGGSVYHDLGNLNFSFVKGGENTSLTDFEEFTKPIVEVIRKLGANARFSGKNDLMIDDKKIAGNAAHRHKDKILQHGCLLFSSEIRNVSEALKINPAKYSDRAVKSIPNRVTNISDHITEKVDVQEFAEKLMSHILETVPGARLYKFTDEDLAIIQKLRDEKYATDEWNFGKSPAYNFKKSVRTKGGLLEMNMEVNKGVIEKIKIFGDFFSNDGIENLESVLVGVKHNETAIGEALKKLNISHYLSNVEIDEIIEAMF